MAEAQDMSLVKVRNLSVSLGGNSILSGIDLDVMPGTIHALIGPNGAGKTTLMRSITGGMPHQGSIIFRFRSTARIGYVPQLLSFDHTIPITVLDFFTIMLRRAPLFLTGTHKTRDQVARVLAETHSDHLADRLIGGLSGGELRRVLLAQALLPMPELLLLDEPVSNVDEHGAMLFEQILLRLKKDNRMTILMVGHDISMILRTADRVTSINRTRTFDGPAEDLKDKEKVAILLAGSRVNKSK